MIDSNKIQFVLDMGKHAPYIWAAWSITVLGLTSFIVYSIFTRKQFIKQQKLFWSRQKIKTDY